MINEDAIKKLEDAGIGLADTALLIIYGGLPVEQLKGFITSEYKEYTSLNRDPNKETKDHVQEVQNNLNMARMGGAAGITLAMSRIRDRLQFETIPALSIASQASGDYASAFADSLRTREDILFKYGMMGGAAGGALGMVAHTMLGNRVLSRVGRMGKWGSRIDNTLRVVKNLRNVRRAASAGAAIASGGTALLGVAAWFAIDYALVQAGESVARWLAEGYATEMSGRTFARQILDRQLVVDDFIAARAPLLNTQGFLDGSMYDQLDSVRLMGSLNNLSPRDVGQDYGAIIENLSQISRSMHFRDNRHYNEYASNTVVLGELYGVGSDAMTPIFADLAMSGFQPKDIDEAVEEFGKFFASVVGGGDGPHTAQLMLVQELASFARNYGFANKFADNAPDELAKIHKFVTGGIAQDMQTTQPTQDLVRGVDSLLNEGGMMRNAAMQDLMRVSGITNFEAIKGVTNDADTMNKFIHGVTQTMGIHRTDFNESGQLNEDKMRQFFTMMTQVYGADTQTTQAVMAATYAYTQGGRAEEVNAEYIRAFESSQSSKLASSSVYSMITDIVDQDVKMVQVIKDTLPVLNSLDEAMLTYFTEYMPNVTRVTAKFAESINDIAKKFTSGQVPSAESYSRALTAAGASASSGGSVGAGGVSRRFTEISGPLTSGNILSSVESQYRQSLMSDNFIDEVVKTAENIGVRPDYLLAIMGFETGYTFSPSERNRAGSSAIGLIQFMASTAEGLGTSTAALAGMSQVQQLAYVEKYFNQFNLPVNPTIADLYMAVLWPRAVGKDPNYVLWEEGVPVYDSEGKATYPYEPNKGLDINRDKVITKDEAARKVINAYIKLFGNATGGVIPGGSQSTSMVEYNSNENNVTIEVLADFVDLPSMARHIEQSFSEAIINGTR